MREWKEKLKWVKIEGGRGRRRVSKKDIEEKDASVKGRKIEKKWCWRERGNCKKKKKLKERKYKAETEELENKREKKNREERKTGKGKK